MEFNIRYNPYSNEIHFRKNNCELPDGSSFLQYQKKKVILQNCIEDIIDLINRYENISSEGVDISFEGTKEDYDILCETIKNSNDEKAKRLKTKHLKKYISSNDAIREIRDCYKEIEKEFETYIARENDKLGLAVLKFQETVKPEIPVCVIGNYSVGKSAFINALIGREILPSKLKATTSKNVIVRNGEKYSVVIYKKTDNEESRYTFKINENGRITVSTVNGSNRDTIVKQFIDDIEKYTDADSCMYHLLGKINEIGNEKEYGIKETIEVTVPFYNSLLEREKYRFAFIDTPGSNNIEINQEAHLENLEKILREQTNALPIFITDASCVSGRDNGELKKLLDRFEGGFSIQNIILVIAKSDSLTESELKEEDAELIKQWNITTKMYVCQVLGIGEKKKDKKYWIQEGYEDRYKKIYQSVIDLDAPSHNKTPCGRSLPEEVEKDLSKGLIASGIPQVESEILYFARTYADYKKSVNGRVLLLEALKDADDKLREQKQKLDEHKKQQEKEQKEKRQEIEMAINEVPCEFINDVVDFTSKKYSKILDIFIKEAKKEAKRFWHDHMNEKDAKDKLIVHMKKFGQNELYGKNCRKMDQDVREKYLENITNYCNEVQNCVMNHEESLSKTTKKNLKNIFCSSNSTPNLDHVEPKGFESIKIGIKSFLSKKEKFVDIYLEHYIKKLAGDKKKFIGIFYKDCIQVPAIEYSKQIKGWKNNYLKKINGELCKPGSILSIYDEKIAKDEEQIRDLEERLERLVSVRETLEELLNLKEV